MAYSQESKHQTSNNDIGPVAESSQLIYIREEQTSGTSAGTFTNGAWRTRVLNTVVLDDTGEASISSNQFTIPAGTYRISARGPGFGIGNHKIRLQNITDGATTLLGNSAFTGSTATTQEVNIAHLFGEFTITSAKAFELQHRCSTTVATIGLGNATSFGVTEIYAEVELQRINPPFTVLPGQQKYALLRHEEASGVNGGGLTLGDWRTRTMNTTVVDEIGITLAADAFTLPAGTYRFSASAPSVEVSAHKIRLQNTSDATTVSIGESAFSGANFTVHTHSRLEGQFSISASKTFELQHRATATRNNDGFGVASSFGVVEVYASIEFLKIA